MKSILLAIPMAVAATAVFAGEPPFEAQWRAASASPQTDAAYRQSLQSYFDTHRGYRECGATLPDGEHARMLLTFDAAGRFEIRGEGVYPDAEECLRVFFTRHQPPRPSTLPLQLPYTLQ